MLKVEFGFKLNDGLGILVEVLFGFEGIVWEWCIMWDGWEFKGWVKLELDVALVFNWLGLKFEFEVVIEGGLEVMFELEVVAEVEIGLILLV